jgi:hypothetical protein
LTVYSPPAIRQAQQGMKKRKTYTETKTIDGFSITYETEGGRKFAYGHCPICGHKEESIQLTLDAGPITASKLRVHIKMAHEKQANAKTQ